MSSSKSNFAVLTAVLVTIATGVVYGRLSHRWGASPDLVSAGRRLAEFPKVIGPWQLVESKSISDFAVQMLECTGYVNRRYVNRATGESIAVAIVVGPTGPIAVHTPEICYSSRAYEVAQTGVRREIVGADSRKHSFWTATFEPTRPNEEPFRVYYAWNDGEAWEAATAPRFQYATAPMLYKIQVSSLIASSERDPSADAAGNFLQAVLLSGWSPSSKPLEGSRGESSEGISASQALEEPERPLAAES